MSFLVLNQIKRVKEADFAYT